MIRGRSTLSTQLVEAYEAAEYCVDAGVSFVLRIGRPSAALARVLRRHGTAACAFITACNPEGQLLSAAENAARTLELEADLRRFSPLLLPASGVDPAGHWPEEPGFLVLGCAPAVIEVLGRRYRQNAVVLCQEDAVPRLLLLR